MKMFGLSNTNDPSLEGSFFGGGISDLGVTNSNHTLPKSRSNVQAVR